MKPYNYSSISSAVFVFVLCGSILLSAAPVAAWTAAAGWTRSDVGLQNREDGLYLGVSNAITWDNPVFDARYAFEYVQKKGSQPTFFSDPVGGFALEDAEVTLHMVQPAIFFGARIPNLSFVPRAYVGGSFALKVNESWADFPGVPHQAYGYKETDVVVHVGASLGVGAFVMDVRWSKSTVGQLLIDTQATPLDTPAKATDVLAGIAEPESGAKTEVVQVSIGFVF